MTLRDAIIILSLSTANDYKIVSSGSRKQHNPDYWKSVKADYDRKQAVIGYWQRGTFPGGELNIHARYYYWWCVLMEYVYIADNLKKEVYEYEDGTHTSSYFHHMAKLLRNGRDVMLGKADPIQRATVAPMWSLDSWFSKDAA